MHNTALKYAAVLFFVGMTILVGASIYTITTKTTTKDEDTGYIKDGQLTILNRIDGIDGPALYVDQRLQTSLEACNLKKDTIHVTGDGVFRRESNPPVLVVVDPTTTERPPGCFTLIRMSPSNIGSRGLTPGTWHIEGARSVKDGTKELQRITFKSESFQVLMR